MFIMNDFVFVKSSSQTRPKSQTTDYSKIKIKALSRTGREGMNDSFHLMWVCGFGCGLMSLISRRKHMDRFLGSGGLRAG